MDLSGHDYLSTLAAIGAVSIVASISGVIGGVLGAAHGARGMVGGFVGSFTGTALSFGFLPVFTLFAGPAALPLSFGIGNAVGDLLDTWIVEGDEAFRPPLEERTFADAIASFIIGAALGSIGSQGTQALSNEVEATIKKLPPSWETLGNISRKTGVLERHLAESGLEQDIATEAKLFYRATRNALKELFLERSWDKLQDSVLVPITKGFILIIDHVLK
jgi:hypothetical protein